MCNVKKKKKKIYKPCVSMYVQKRRKRTYEDIIIIYFNLYNRA
jgi:hypothetical protein